MSVRTRILLLATLLAIATGGAGNAASGTGTAPARPRSIAELYGQRIPPNPDSMAVRAGRRPVPPTRLRFHGGAPSLDSLARLVVAAIAREDPQIVRRASVTRDEFTGILWPEMPQSAPASGATAEDAWTILDHRLLGGSRSVVDDYAGRRLRYEGVVSRFPEMRFRNYRMIRGIGIAVYDSSAGRVDTIGVVRTVAERRGRYKIYSMRD